MRVETRRKNLLQPLCASLYVLTKSSKDVLPSEKSHYPDGGEKRALSFAPPPLPTPSNVGGLLVSVMVESQSEGTAADFSKNKLMAKHCFGGEGKSCPFKTCDKIENRSCRASEGCPITVSTCRILFSVLV